MSGLYAVDLEGGIPALESKRKVIGATKVVISPRTAFSAPEIVPRYILNLVTSVEIVGAFCVTLTVMAFCPPERMTATSADGKDSPQGVKSVACRK